MSPLVLVGAGGLAREVLASERAAGRRGSVTVLDDDPARWGAELSGGARVAGGLDLVLEYADHEVLVHPELGEIEVDCQVLFTEDRAPALLVLTPQPRSAAEEKIRLLGVLGSQRFASR